MKMQRFSISLSLGLALGGLLLPMQTQLVQAQSADSDFGAGGFDSGEVVPGIVTEGTNYNSDVNAEEGLVESVAFDVYIPTATNIIQQLSVGTYPPAIEFGISSESQQNLANIFVLDTDDDVYITSKQEIVNLLVAEGISSEEADDLIETFADILDPLNGDDSVFLGGDALTSSNQESSLVACAEECELAQAEPGVDPAEVQEEVKSQEELEEEIMFRITEADKLLAAVDAFNNLVDELPSEQVVNPPASVLLLRSVLYDFVAATWVDGEPPSMSEE